MKHVHVIGVAGVATAPLAVLYKELGWKVTGSDRAFFPPMSTYLEERGIEIMPGFKQEHLTPVPDLVIAMAFVTENNPEVREAREQGVPVKAYSEVLGNLIERKNSVVVAGSRAKTTVTALLAWLLETAGYNPGFMVGGIPLNFENGIRRTDSDWSVLEGDEYPVASWKQVPKFFEYRPTHLVLTGAAWDHMDVYPTKEKYLAVFKELVSRIPADGKIVANKGGENVEEVVTSAKAPVFWYNAGEDLPFVPPFGGGPWEENTKAVLAFARALNIQDSVTQDALRSFAGVRRRQEVRAQKDGIAVIDDNAHSPEKVTGLLSTLRAWYPSAQIAAVYEPGSRSKAALAQEGYRTCFEGASAVFLPRVSANAKEKRGAAQQLAERIPGAVYVPSDEELVEKLTALVENWRAAGKQGVVAFMSQKGFRGMIDEVAKTL